MECQYKKKKTKQKNFNKYPPLIMAFITSFTWNLVPVYHEHMCLMSHIYFSQVLHVCRYAALFQGVWDHKHGIVCVISVHLHCSWLKFDTLRVLSEWWKRPNAIWWEHRLYIKAGRSRSDVIPKLWPSRIFMFENQRWSVININMNLILIKHNFQKEHQTVWMWTWN